MHFSCHTSAELLHECKDVTRVKITNSAHCQNRHRHSSFLPFFHGNKKIKRKKKGEGKGQEKYEILVWIEYKIATVSSSSSYLSTVSTWIKIKKIERFL